MSRRYRYSPALLADGRRRYEQTDEPATTIAADFGINKSTLSRMAGREGWVRYVPPVRDLPAAARLAAEADALTQTPFIPAPAEIRAPDRHVDASGPGSPLSRGRTDEFAPPQDTVARLQAAVLAELTSVEAMRLALKSLPQKPADAARTARTLVAAHRHALPSCSACRPPAPQQGHANDFANDMPADIDEFRRRSCAPH